MATESASRRALFIVFLVVFIDLLGFGIVLPLLPRYAKVFLGNEAGWQGGVIIGSLFAVFSLMQFIFAPIWGSISDRVGRRPILLIGLAGSTLSYALFGYGSDLGNQSPTLGLTLLFISRTFAGIAGATISTAQAVIADCTPPEGRSKGMALIGMAFGFGFCFGPLLGAGAVWWLPHALGAPCYLAAGLSAVALGLGVSMLSETLPLTGGEHRHRWFNPRALLDALTHPTVGVLVLAFFLATFGFANFESTLSLLTQAAFNMGEGSSFLVFAYVGFVLMLAQGGLYRRYADRLGEKTFLILGVSLMLLGLANLAGIAALAGAKPESLVASPLFWWFLGALLIAVTGFAFVNPSVQSLISRATAGDRQGEVLGANQSAGAMARILGPVVGLGLFNLSAHHTANQSAGAMARILGPVVGLGLFNLSAHHTLPYLVAALLLGSVLVLMPRVRQ